MLYWSVAEELEEGALSMKVEMAFFRAGECVERESRMEILREMGG